MEPTDQQLSSHQFLTAPNLFTLARLCCIPLFLWMLFTRDNVAGAAFLLGGLSPVELVLSQVLVLITAVPYALYGLWCSSAMRSTLTATVATFAGTLFLTFGIPMLAFVAIMMLGFTGFSIGTPVPALEMVLIYVGLVIAATNLPATLVLSETFLLNQDTLLGYTHHISSQAMWIFSPWWLFIIIHVLAAVVLYGATVRRVRRISDV